MKNEKLSVLIVIVLISANQIATFKFPAFFPRQLFVLNLKVLRQAAETLLGTLVIHCVAHFSISSIGIQ